MTPFSNDNQNNSAIVPQTENEVPSRMPPTNIQCPVSLSDGLFQDKITEVADITQAPAPLVIQGMISTCALLFQGLVDVRKPNGQIEPTSIYTIGIAESGERKSTIASAYMRPIHEFLGQRTGEKASKALREYEQERDIWQATRRRLIQNISKTKASEDLEYLEEDTRKERLEKLHQQLEDHELEKPTQPISLGINTFSNITPAGLLSAVREQGLSSVGLFTAEGEELMENGMQQKLSTLNAPWSGEPIQISRATTGSADLRFRLSIYLQVQPAVAQDFFHKRNSRARNIGLVARALLTFPPSHQGFRSTRTFPESSEVDLRYRARVAELLERNIEAFQDEGFQRSVLGFSPDAQQLWLVVSDEIERATGPGGRFYESGDHAAKLSDNIARVAALIHAFDYDINGEISCETLERAIRLCFFFSDEFFRIFLSQPDYDVLEANSLGRYLRGMAASNRYLRKSSVKMNGPVRPSNFAENAISVLIQRGNIRVCQFRVCNEQGKPVKPVEIIDLHPHMPHDQWEMQRVATRRGW